MEEEIDRRIGALSSAGTQLVCCGEEGAESEGEVLNLPSIYVLVLTDGHELEDQGRRNK